MKRLTALQPTAIGFGLFTIAAGILAAMTIAGHVGLLPLAQALGRAAQPICAAAIAVLMYLGISERKLEADR